MRAWFGGQAAVLGAALVVCVTGGAAARPSQGSTHAGAFHANASHASARAIQAGMKGYAARTDRRHAGRGAWAASSGGGGGGLQCVPFARENSGIELSGNAATWWDNAEGVYERGARPEVGSVLNFRANGRMRMGHVAVVANVIDSRNIEIDHANWAGPGGGRGSVSRNITVVDVSPTNDWSAVRVALGHSGDFGSIYPTYGFIYDRPDHGTMVANNATAPAPALNAPPRDLRPASERAAVPAGQEAEEVAEASDDTPVRTTRSYGRRGHAVVERVMARGATHLTGRAAEHGHRTAALPTRGVVMPVRVRAAQAFVRPAGARRHHF